MDKDISKKCCKCEPYETGFIEACKDRSNCLYGPIQWDDKFVRLVIGIASKDDAHMEILNRIVEIIRTDQNADALIEHATVETLYQKLNGFS